MARRIRLTVAYDGTDYHGWQLQPNGITVEAVLNQTLSELLQEEIQVIGASRTDSGVHALGNIAVFDTNSRIPGEKFSYALNQRLPEDIRIQKSCEVPADWHPRHQNSRKTYEYRICNREFPLPTERLYSYFTYAKLDVEAMREACRYLEGEHDFASFASAGNQTETTIRRIYSLGVFQEADRITIRVTGSGFLYNMVRIVAGTLLDVGMGRKKPEQMEAILKAADRAAAGPTAPACGLFLMGYEFDGEA